MLANLRRLAGYRPLIQSLVARDLKARYRGSTLGFLWSFLNPLLLLLVYTFVFAVMPGVRGANSVFMFCGLLPWSWFSTSLLESSSVLVSGGNLIRKVLFPAEVLPLVTVIAGLVTADATETDQPGHAESDSNANSSRARFRRGRR